MFRNRLLTRAVLYRDREGAAERSSRKRFKSSDHQESDMCVALRKDDQEENKLRYKVRRPYRWSYAVFFALILSLIGWPFPAAGQNSGSARQAPDPTGLGEFAVVTSQYRLAATTDPTIMNDRVTEI